MKSSMHRNKTISAKMVHDPTKRRTREHNMKPMCRLQKKSRDVDDNASKCLALRPAQYFWSIDRGTAEAKQVNDGARTTKASQIPFGRTFAPFSKHNFENIKGNMTSDEA